MYNVQQVVKSVSCVCVSIYIYINKLKLTELRCGCDKLYGTRPPLKS